MNEPMNTSGKKQIKPPGIPLTSSGSGTSTSLGDLIKQIQLKLEILPMSVPKRSLVRRTLKMKSSKKLKS